MIARFIPEKVYYRNFLCGAIAPWARPCGRSRSRLRPRRLGIPDLDVVEKAVFAGDAQFNLGLGGVANACRLEKGGRLPVNRHTHRVADGFDDERVPLAGFELGGERGAVGGEQLADFGFVLVDVFPQLDQSVALAAVAFVKDGNLVEANLRAAEMAVVGAGEFAIIKLHVNHRGAFEADLAFDDTVLGGNFQAIDGGMGGDDRFPVLGRRVFLARLRALERPLLEGESIDDLMPWLRGRGTLEVIGEKKLLLMGDGFSRDGGQIGGESSRCDERKGGEENARVHGMSGSSVMVHASFALGKHKCGGLSTVPTHIPKGLSHSTPRCRSTRLHWVKHREFHQPLSARNPIRLTSSEDASPFGVAARESRLSRPLMLLTSTV